MLLGTPPSYKHDGHLGNDANLLYPILLLLGSNNKYRATKCDLESDFFSPRQRDVPLPGNLLCTAGGVCPFVSPYLSPSLPFSEIPSSFSVASSSRRVEIAPPIRESYAGKGRKKERERGRWSCVLRHFESTLRGVKAITADRTIISSIPSRVGLDITGHCACGRVITTA